jgi:pimeloyl-ACP methyl ester carboxylesterase
MTRKEGVVLVHGLWTHGLVMTVLDRRIVRSGYEASRFSYPSVRLTLTDNADRLADHCGGLPFGKLHFLGHSLGGLVILRMLERAPRLPVGRIVLAGTPYVTSFAAARLEQLPGGRAMLGRSVPEWLARASVRRGGNHEIGVIAGSLSAGLGRLVARGLPAPNDGVVTVEETRLPDMCDHIVLPINHSGMLVSAAVARQACAFFRNGAFSRQPEKVYA